MTASIWQPGSTPVPTANADNTLKPQTFIATAGQALFTLTNFVYQPATGSLLVFVNGVQQNITTDFVETSNSSFTVTGGVGVGDVVTAFGFVGVTAAQAATVSAAQAATSVTQAVSAANSAIAAYNAIIALGLPSLPLSVANGGTGANNLSAFQVALVSGTNIKTVGGTTILGLGDIPFPAIPTVPDFLLYAQGVI